MLIDVRHVPSYQDGHLPGARSIPDAELPGRLTEVPREGPVVVYGATTLEAVGAYERLRLEGYSDVRVLIGGFLHWVVLKYPVER